MFRKILLAYDGSEGANRALAVGIGLAKIHGAELWALAVEEKLPRFSGTIDEVQEEKQFADEQMASCWRPPRSKAKEAGIELKTLMHAGHPAQTVVGAAKKASSTWCWWATPAFPGFGRHSWEPPPRKVSRHAPCSVLIVR